MTKFTRHLLRFPRALQLPSRHALGVRPPRTRARVVQLVFASIASIHTSVTRHRSRAREAHKKNRSIDRSRPEGARTDRRTDRSPSAVSSPRLLVSSRVPPSTLHQIPTQDIFIFFEKSNFFVPYTYDFFQSKNLEPVSSEIRCFARVFRCPVDDAWHRGIISSSPTRRLSRRLATRSRARAYLSSLGVPIETYPTHLVYRRRKNGRARVRQSCHRSSQRARARGLFLSHEPSRVPPPPRARAHATIHSNACMNPRRIDRRPSRSHRRSPRAYLHPFLRPRATSTVVDPSFPRVDARVHPLMNEFARAAHSRRPRRGRWKRARVASSVCVSIFES